MENYKKPIIAGAVTIIIIAAIATVLGFSSGSVRQKNKVGSGISAPNSTDMLPVPMSGRGMSLQSKEGAVTDSVGAADFSADKKVIKNGYLTMKVNDVSNASENIGTIARNNGGDVFSFDAYKDPQTNIKSGTVSVRVPVANFEKTVAEIKKVAALVVQESTSGQDVTEEYADLQAQLKNKQAEEQQYLQIMKQAQKISDILEVTQQLSRVRGEIEQLQGHIKFLDSQADMSLITAHMTEDANITISDSWRPWQIVKESVNNLIKKSQGFVNFIIVLVITVIPIAILYLLLAYIIYWIGRRVYSKFKKPEQK